MSVMKICYKMNLPHSIKYNLNLFKDFMNYITPKTKQRFTICMSKQYIKIYILNKNGFIVPKYII